MSALGFSRPSFLVSSDYLPCNTRPLPFSYRHKKMDLDSTVHSFYAETFPKQSRLRKIREFKTLLAPFKHHSTRKSLTKTARKTSRVKSEILVHTYTICKKTDLYDQCVHIRPFEAREKLTARKRRKGYINALQCSSKKDRDQKARTIDYPNTHPRHTYTRPPLTLTPS